MKYYVVTALSLLALVGVKAETVNGFTFELDGAPHDFKLMAIEGETPRPGAVVQVRHLSFCLDEPGTYSFTLKDMTLERTLGDGKSMVVACEVGEAPVYDTSRPIPTVRPIVNPLAAMDDAALKSLRGVLLNAWPEGIEKQLAKLDWEKVCLKVDRGVLRKRDDKMPSIPTEVRTLIMDTGGRWICRDKSAFVTLKKLRFLDLHRAWPDDFDFAVLKGMPLEYLNVPFAHQAANFDTLASLDQLKTLVANRCHHLGDGRWLGRLTRLQHLCASDLQSYGNVTIMPLDLSFLPGLKDLSVFKVDRSDVKNLPPVTMPALKEASLLQSSAVPESVEAFSKANPQAKTLY